MKILGFPIPGMIMKLCKPAQVYLILSLIGLVIYIISMLNVHDTVLEVEPKGEGIHDYTISGLVINIIFTIIWIYLLNPRISVSWELCLCLWSAPEFLPI